MGRLLSIGFTSRMHQQGQQQTQRIDDDMALAAFDTLVAIETALPSHVRGLDRSLGVEVYELLKPETLMGICGLW